MTIETLPHSQPTLLLLGGNDRSLWANRGDLIGLLLAEGWDVQAALPPQGAVHHPPLHDIPTHRVPIERTGMNPLADLRAVRSVRALISELAPDVVLAYNPKPVIFGGLVPKALSERENPRQVGDGSLDTSWP